MKKARKERAVGELVHDLGKFLVALGRTWITYLAFLPSLESLISAYYNIDFPINFPPWVKGSFPALVLVLAGFTVWREQYKGKKDLLESISSKGDLRPRYEFSGEIMPVHEYTRDLKIKSRQERDWADAKIAQLSTIHIAPLAHPSLDFCPDRHDYERYIERIDQYLNLLDQFKENSKYQQRCFIDVKNSGAKADEQIKISLHASSSEEGFIEWPRSILDPPQRPRGRAMPHFEVENVRSVPFREVLTSNENFISVELRALRPGEKKRLLRSGFLVAGDSRAEFNFEVISKYLSKPQTGCFVIKGNLEKSDVDNDILRKTNG